MAEPVIQYRIPDDFNVGVYANVLNVWHTGHEFTLDFGTTLPPEPHGDEILVPVQVTSRVKIPVGLAFEVIKALNANLARYEEAFGAVKQLGDNGPAVPPDDLIGGGE